MSDVAALDIPYLLNNAAGVPGTGFLSIWKVDANDSYQAIQKNGFRDPGLFLTYKGNGSLTVEEEDGNVIRHELGSGTWFMLDRNIPCHYGCPKDGHWKFYFFHFSDLEMAIDLSLRSGQTERTERMPYFVSLCENVIEALILQQPPYAHVVNQLFREILIMLAREKADREQPRDPAIVRALYWMHKNIGQPLRVDELARLANMSRTHFFNRFKAVTTSTPADYFLRLKLQSAKVHLQSTQMTIKEIATSLGFYDAYHFSKHFKRQFGLSPSQYRNRR